MGGCQDKPLREDLDRIAALEASEYELQLQIDEDDDVPVTCARAYGLETAGALLARQAERLGLPADGLELEFSNELVPAECVLQDAGIMEGATVRVLGVPAMRRKLVRTDTDIREAVKAWLSDPVQAEVRYGHIARWNVKAVTDMGGLFCDEARRHGRLPFDDATSFTSFNQDLSRWDVSSVSSMRGMFRNARSFDQDLSRWDVSNVRDMALMFQDARSFNQDLDGWDVSNVRLFDGMFKCAYQFNRDLSGWDVSNAVRMQGMFASAYQFNQDLSHWDVSNVADMGSMFASDSAYRFNQGLGGWDVSSVKNMHGMFEGACSFDQDLGGWEVSNDTDIREMFEGCAIGSRWATHKLPGWYTHRKSFDD